jgi:hypothetical protein
MTFSVTKRYTCPGCGYSGKGWVYIGIQDMTSEHMGKWKMANCPRCHSTRCVEQMGKFLVEPKGE